MVARIEHPHIVPLIDFWRDPDSAYFVMRWLRGGTLERRLDDGPLSVEQALLVAHQIGAALTAAHVQGVLHRDVKAANVLFDEQGNAFLADFGIALEATQSGGPEAALSQGSPAYASPEQIRRQPLGPEADVFSFGIVLFEAFVGSLPFPANESMDELVEHQLNDPVPPLPELRAAGNRKEFYYLDTTSGELEVLATVADSSVVAPVIIADGGFRLFSDDGMLRSYDSTGAVTGEIDTGLQRPAFPRSDYTVWARSDDDRLAAFGNGTGVIIVDTTTETTTTVPTFGKTESLRFARGDSLLMVGSDDGTVRAWDVERNVSRGVLWRGPTEVTFATWYDDDSDSLRIAEEQRLLELPLNPDVYLQRACEVVNRDLSQDEWDQYVPDGRPVRIACT